MTADAAVAGGVSLDEQRARYARGELVLVLERPRPAAQAREIRPGALVVSGYALSRAGVRSVRVEVAGHAWDVPVDRRRPEVRLSFLEPQRPRLEIGFELVLDGDGWAPGSLPAHVAARDDAGHSADAATLVRWAPDRDRLMTALARGRPLLWWASPLCGDPPAGEFVVVHGVAAALRDEPRVTITLAGRAVQPSLSIAAPEVRQWAARPLGVTPHLYHAILDLRALARGDAELLVTVEDGAGGCVRRSGLIRVDRTANYRRWLATRRAAQRPRPAPTPDPIALDVFVDWDGVHPARLIDSLAAQEHADWSVRSLGGVPAAARASAAWTHCEQGKRVGEAVGGMHEALQALAAEGPGGGGSSAAVFVRAQDELLPGALARIALELAGDSPPDVLYADDELESGDGEVTPRLKPGWSPQLLLGGDYAGPLVAVAPRAARDALATGERIETAYELLVALVDQECTVARIPEALCRLRSGDPPVGGSAGGNPDEAVRALARRAGASVSIEPVPGLPGMRRVRWPLRTSPSVSLVLPSATRRQWLQTCLRSLRAHTDYDRFQVVLVDSGPGIAAALADELLGGIAHVVVPYAPPAGVGPYFNFSTACNIGAEHSDGELLVFLNDDVQFVDRTWLRSMVEFGVLPDVGAVGIRTMWPDGLVQSCGLGGMRLERGEFPTDLFKGLEGSSSGPQHILTVAHECAAATGACVLLRRSVLAQVGGWDEAFPLDMGDWELCMRVWAAGLRVLVVPWSSVTHFETSTRSSARDWSLLEGLAARWRPLHHDGDPWLHPGLRAATYPSLDVDGDAL